MDKKIKYFEIANESECEILCGLSAEALAERLAFAEILRAKYTKIAKSLCGSGITGFDVFHGGGVAVHGYGIKPTKRQIRKMQKCARLHDRVKKLMGKNK